MGKVRLYGVDARDFRNQIRASIPRNNVQRLDAALAPRFAIILERWLDEVIDRALDTTTLNVTPGLEAAVRSSPRVTGRRSLLSLAGRWWVDPWLSIHETGGTVRAKQKYLTIPFADGLRSDGMTPKFRSANSWRRFGSFVYTAKTGSKFLVYKNAQGELKFLYVLVENVRIPARLGIRQTANREIQRLYNAWASVWLDVMLRNGFAIPNDIGGLAPRNSRRRR